MRRLGVVLAALVVLASVAGATSPAPATPAEAAQPTPVYRTDGVEGRMNTYASQVSEAHIWDLEVVGTTIYVAGKFTKVVRASGSWPRVNQRFLAAFDTETGEWVSSWRPRLNRPAYALDVLPSGSIVAAGEFTLVNGGSARAIVALDPVTGATDTRFRAGVLRKPDSNRFAVVRDLDVRGNRVYAVGHFNRAQGPTGSPLVVQKAVRFSTATGAPDRTWIPRLAGNTAYAVAVSTDGKRVHLGGEFSSVNGRNGTSQLATVTARTGRLVPGWNHGSNATPWPTWPVGGVVFDLDVYKNNLYLAGAEHYWERRNSTTGASLRFERISNDGQTVEVVGNRVYIGCHCYHRDPNRQVWEVNAATGAPYPGRTGALRSGDGTWATAVAEDGCLWLGGDFNVATNLAGQGAGEYWVGRLARLCPAGGPESVPAPTPRRGPINPPGWTPAEAQD